ncbi:MAG: 2OG-Fe(II) oxygenase [Lentisphaeraceae bacterium]|nr:2OG-Fe(II) oxygenase [Lentisphaeraceae bacterium]
MISTDAILNTVSFEKITQELSEKRFSSVDNFLPQTLYKSLCREVRRQHMEGLTRPAKVGRLASARQNKKIRGDKIRWVSKDLTPASVHKVFDIVEDLRMYLKQNLFLPLHDSEYHFAVYPPGGYYKRHLDCHKNANNRVITFILYLNRKNWSAKNGGQLKVWHSKAETEEILPVGNRLVVFSSPDFYHSVLPCQVNRCSLTGWFRRVPPLF